MKKLLLLLLVLLPMLLSAQNLVPKKLPKKDLYGYWGEKKNGKEGFVIKPQFSKVTKFAGGHAFVCKEGAWYVVGVDGKAISNKRYSKVESLVSDVYHYRVWQWGKCGVLDLANNIEILPVQYDEISIWKQGGYLLRCKDEYALVGDMGRNLVKPVYYIGNDIYALYNDKWLFVNKDGKEVDVANRVVHYSTNNGAKLSSKFLKSDYNLFYGGKGVLVYDAPVTSIGDYTFYGCSSLTNVIIGNSVTSIGNAAFSGCSSLTSFKIPNSVTKIGRLAFYGCCSLASVTIGNSVTSIGVSAFSGCTGELFIHCDIPGASSYFSGVFSGSKFTKVTIENSVTSIGAEAFCGCSSLTSITIPNSVTRIGDKAFSSCDNLTSITIPNSVIWIGKGAFEYCWNLKSVYVPNMSTWCRIGYSKIYSRSIVYVGEKKLKEFTEIVIPSDVKYIVESAFEDCSSLTSITIPNSVTAIGEKAFAGCSNLKSVTIPDSVTKIQSKAFYNCTSLKTVHCNVVLPPYLGEEVFDYYGGRICCPIYVPSSSLKRYKGVGGNWDSYSQYLRGR